MNIDEKLIGFDARRMWLDADVHWGSDRRAHYLLRQDTNPILSTDDFVWPSVFETHQMPGAPEPELDGLGLSGPERPAWIGPNIPLWEDLDQLRIHLVSKDSEIRRPYWIIAVTCLAQPRVASRLTLGPYFGQTNPYVCNEAWTFLGHDVSDGSLTSGLTNCGDPRKDRMDRAAKQWSRHLNQYHLFTSLQPADEYREYSDGRVQEHAPFAVYGLYLIEEVLGV